MDWMHFWIYWMSLVLFPRIVFDKPDTFWDHLNSIQLEFCIWLISGNGDTFKQARVLFNVMSETDMMGYYIAII